MKALVIHPGTQYSHQLVNQLTRLDLLDRFVTGIGLARRGYQQFFPKWLTRKVANRILPDQVPGHRIHNIIWPEVRGLWQLRAGRDAETVLFQRNKRFQEQISPALIQQTDACIGFDTSSWIVASAANKFGKPFFLDQSIAHPREKQVVFEALQRTYPQWSEDIPVKSLERIALEETEYRLATKIIVASTFTKESMVKHGVSSSRIVLNSYGVGREFFRSLSSRRPDGKFRFLYLGTLGARKGLPFLLDVWNKYHLHLRAELWLVGPATSQVISLVQRVPGVSYRGRLPFREVPLIMDHCDCLVFPSFFEGFGQVILESMAAGLPVITTDATAGPDIIEPGVDGFIIRSGDETELAQAMMTMSGDRGLSSAMGRLAQEKARSFSWDAYGDRWATILRGNSLA